MFEIIWSVFYNKHIVRASVAYSQIDPLFIGTLDECNAKLQNYTSH